MSQRARGVVALIAGLVVLVGCVGLAVMIEVSDDPGATAGVVQGYLAPAAVAITLIGGLGTWWLSHRPVVAREAPGQLEAAAGRLRRQTLLTWRKETRARGIELPAPVTVRWRWADREVAGPGREIAVPAPPGLGPRALAEPGVLLDEGSVTALHDELYVRLPHGRLVVLGEAGGGKTAAMILLLLAALRGPGPVPVWLALSTWDPGRTPLLTWVRAALARDHRFLLAAEYGPDPVGALLESERVALFLDGLDEMPAVSRAAALRRLDEESGPLRIVVTSRSGEYRAAVGQGRWHNAAVIELLPPSGRVIADYLLRDQLDRVGEWRRVVDRLAGDPDGVAALTLNSPLTLSLARIVYRDRSPAELIDPDRFATPARLRGHLLAQYLVTAYPDEAHRARAVSRLAWIAHRMGDRRTLPWWLVPTWVSRWRRALVVAVGLGPLTGVLVGLADRAPLALLVVVSLVASLHYGSLSVVHEIRTGRARSPQTMIVRPPAWNDLPMLVRSAPGVVMTAVLSCGLLIAQSYRHLPPTLYNGLLFGALAGWGAGLTIGTLQLWYTPVSHLAAVGARDSYVRARTATLAGAALIALGSGLTVALCVFLATPQLPGPETLLTALIAGSLALAALWTTFKLSAGVTSGLAAVLGSVLILRPSPVAAIVAGSLLTGTSYAISVGPAVSLWAAEAVLGLRGRERFGALLADAHDRQVLRQVGTLYEFRHAELQDHLARQYAGLTAPPAGSGRDAPPPR